MNILIKKIRGRYHYSEGGGLTDVLLKMAGQ